MRDDHSAAVNLRGNSQKELARRWLLGADTFLVALSQIVIDSVLELFAKLFNRLAVETDNRAYPEKTIEARVGLEKMATRVLRCLEFTKR